MKASLIPSLLFALTSLSSAGFDVPRHAFALSELDQAASEAIEKGKGITFVYTNNEST